MTFDPKQHFTKIKGKGGAGRDYLDVKWRVVWFRDEYPDWTVNTQVIQLEPFAVMRAEIINPEGRLIATGHGMAKDTGNNVWSGRAVEKAETAAIGRALALAGFGTQFAEGFEDSEDDHLADSPSDKPKAQSKAKSTPQQKEHPHMAGETMAVTLSGLTVRARRDNPDRNVLAFKVKGAEIEVYAFSRDKFRERGWIEGNEWGDRKEYRITQLIPAQVKYVIDEDNSGYWVVKEVDLNPLQKAAPVPS